jgi:hypothetical protein
MKILFFAMVDLNGDSDQMVLPRFDYKWSWAWLPRKSPYRFSSVKIGVFSILGLAQFVFVCPEILKTERGIIKIRAFFCPVLIFIKPKRSLLY